MQDPEQGFSGDFPVTLGVEDLGGAIEIEVDVTFTDPGALLAGCAILKYFEAAGEAGMFATSFTAASDPARTTSLGVVHTWQVQGLQLGALRLFLNMLANLHRSNPCVSGVRMVGTSTGRGGWISVADIQGASYPLPPQPLPFIFSAHQRMDEVREPALRYEFGGPVGDLEMTELRAMLKTWVALVGFGAFGQPLEEAGTLEELEELLESQQIYRSAPTTVEHLFYEFEGPGAAFDLLHNLCARLHQRFPNPVVALQLE